MTANVKVFLVLGALVFANMAVWGARQMLAGVVAPILRALGA